MKILEMPEWVKRDALKTLLVGIVPPDRVDAWPAEEVIRVYEVLTQDALDGRI